MPELPEVETVRAGLAPAVTGAKVLAVHVFEPRSLRRHPGPTEDFIGRLTGATLLGCVRRGKFLWLPLELAGESSSAGNEAPLALVGHLGMSGQILLRTPGFEADKLTRIVLEIKSVAGERLEVRFIDQRIFGGLALDPMRATVDGGPGGFCPEVPTATWSNLIPHSAAHIARDPLDPNFDAAAVIRKLKTKRTGIKRALLDQNLVSGIGNIYADEALWRARLYFDKECVAISKPKLVELFEHVQTIFAEAVAQGGTSFDEQYKNVNGESGYFSQTLNAYGLTGLPCKRCGTPIKRLAWANRGSHFCPKCQRP